MRPRQLLDAAARIHSLLMAGAALLAACYSANGMAVPAFARQTGENCVACHAGGLFPELTPYGRMFKLTGYTLGERNIPLSVMGVVSDTKVSNTADPNGDPRADFPAKNGSLVFTTASVFLAGKATNNIGGFVQMTYNNYDHLDPNRNWRGKTVSDNADIRYADRFIDNRHDLVFGLSLNNNPSVQDVWNSAPAWGFDLVPGSNPIGLPTAPLLSGGLAQQVAGVGAYAYWNKTVYAELSAYRTADKFWSFMSQGFKFSDGSRNRLSGSAPYGRVALTRDWGPHSVMLGAMGLEAKLHIDPNDPGSPTNRYSDWGVDGQYQYILDPHAASAQVSYLHERIKYDASLAGQPGAYDASAGTALQPLTSSSDTLELFRAKASYVYRAAYGGTLSYFKLRGSYNSASQAGIPGDPTGLLAGFSPLLPSVSNNITGKPDTTGWTTEVFWLPVQYVRTGVQYTMFSRYLGAARNYDGWGRDAKDNDTLFFYVWGAY
ncbi:MAG: hypothetical protein H6R10_3499 [Rhodocyclaceae bacterium]|nr:hypothetical protein [Rhodocyclaceae bacterium]